MVMKTSKQLKYELCKILCTVLDKTNHNTPLAVSLGVSENNSKYSAIIINLEG